MLRNSCIGLCVLIGGFSTFCYVTFGNATADLITLNLPPSDTVVVLMQLLYSLSLFFTYPLMIFPVTQILENTKFARLICGIPESRLPSTTPFSSSEVPSGTVSGDEYTVLCTADADEVSADENDLRTDNVDEASPDATEQSTNTRDAFWRQNAFRATCVFVTAAIAMLATRVR